MARILIAEDELDSQLFFEEALEGEYELEIVENGQYLFQSFNENVPDLVILDINMPILNGIETCRLLRDYEQHNDIPIILASAQASKRVVDDCGATDFIKKPFTHTELLKLIHQYV